MNATTLGSLLTGGAAVIGAVVVFFGKRSETALAGYTSLTDQLQEERADQRAQIADLQQQLTGRDARIAELSSYRAADQAEITRLRNLIPPTGGQP